MSAEKKLGDLRSSALAGEDTSENYFFLPVEATVNAKLVSNLVNSLLQR